MEPKDKVSFDFSIYIDPFLFEFQLQERNVEKASLNTSFGD